MQLIRWVITAAAMLASAQAFAANKVSFYFAAHEDDWQLFMNPGAFEDVLGGASKTVFVHVTAGDAGHGTDTIGRRWPYYIARENGAENAIQFMTGTEHAPVTPVITHPVMNGHAIYRVDYGKTVAYFLRVADGNPSGTGYEQTGWQSLRRLHEGANNVLAAVDGSTAYHGWDDLVRTFRAIVDQESGHKPVQINVAEMDTRANPGDHSDHLMTAQAALDAMKDAPCVRRVFYIDYASAKLPENLNAEQRDMQSSVYAVTMAGVQTFDHWTSWRHYDDTYVGRAHFRVQEPPGFCKATTAALSAKQH
jgi:hypothetical protein